MENAINCDKYSITRAFMDDKADISEGGSDNRIGANLRNRMAYWLLPDSQFYSASAAPVIPHQFFTRVKAHLNIVQRLTIPMRLLLQALREDPCPKAGC